MKFFSFNKEKRKGQNKNQVNSEVVSDKNKNSDNRNKRRPWAKEDIVKELLNCCNE